MPFPAPRDEARRDAMTSRAQVPSRWKASAAALAVGLGLIGLTSPAGAAPAEDRKIDFNKDVQPIFKTACMKCHGLDPDKPRKKPSAGFRLDDKASAFKGGRSGAAIVPGSSKDSLFFKLLSGPVTVPNKDEDKEISPMPKVKRGEMWKALPDDQIAVIQRWIDQGANWPD
jgi:mono/diheme cytochrome c family protein